MNLHQLTVFRAVVEAGGFSAAAADLRLAQSAVSYHIKALEKEIGEPLFARIRTRVFLTEKGKLLRGHTEKIFQAMAEAERDLCGTYSQAELRFGLGVSSLSECLPAYVKQLQQAWPGVRFRLAAGSTPQIVELLRANCADLGIVTLPIQEPNIQTTPLFYEEEEMLVVTNRESPLARRSEISPADLCGLPLILYNRTTATRASLDECFQQAGVAPMVVMEVDREDTIMELVRSGVGATILPRCFFSTRHDKGLLHFLRLRNAWLRREVGVAVAASRSRTALLNMAVQLCREHFHGGAPHSSRLTGNTRIAVPLARHRN